MSRRRRNETEEQRARRELISDFLSAANIQSMDDIQELFKEALAGFMEGSLESELDSELGYEPYDVKNKETDNSRNGHSKKTLRTSVGKVDIEVPRDRNGEFEPKILPKNQTSISQDMENKIISMYAKGMSTSDIEDHIRDIYGLEISDTTVSRITDKVLPVAKEWQQRPLESIYAVVFLDAIHYHVHSEGQIIKKAVYIAIGANLDGRKDVLGNEKRFYGYRRGFFHLTPERVEAAPEMLEFKDLIYRRFIKKGTVYGDVIEYDTTLGIKLRCGGNLRTLRQFYGYKRINSDKTLSVILGVWEVRKSKLFQPGHRKKTVEIESKALDGVID